MSGGFGNVPGEKIPSRNIPAWERNQGMSGGFSGVKKRTFPSHGMSGNVGKNGIFGGVWKWNIRE